MSAANTLAVPAWERLADLLLQREALHCRMIGAIPAAPTGAIYVTDDDILDLTRELPGLRQATEDEVTDLDSLFTPTIPEASATFGDWLRESSHRFAGLCRRAQLGLRESSLLALLVAIDVDRSRQQVVGYIQDDLSVRHLQVGTVERLFPDGGSGLVSPESALVVAGLVGVDAGSTWADATLRVAGDMVWSVLQDTPARADSIHLLDWQDHASIARPNDLDSGLICVSGGSARERQLIAAVEIGTHAALMVSEPDEKNQWRSAARTALIHDLPIVIEVDQKRPTHDWSTVERLNVVQWIVSSESALSLHDLPKLAFRELRVSEGPHVGAGALGASAWDGAGHLLRLSDIEAVKGVVDSGSLAFDQAIRRLASGELDALATRVELRKGWDDLVLPPKQKERVREVVDRYQNRRQVHKEWGFNAGRAPGVVALFAGPSGTGKTLASQIVAAEVGLDLYRVDLSSMVSKYIGESEKNLARIFDAAENGAVALFFDEADAMFGKRSEVKDSHDRYANLSTSYLLQRIEDFDGVVIMATNLSQNIDAAFKRRIDVQVTFAMPDESLRRDIWSQAVPSAHHERVDFDGLANRFELSGASIHNAVLGGAYLAAAANEIPTTCHFEVAVQRELQKLGQFGGFGAVNAVRGANHA